MWLTNAFLAMFCAGLMTLVLKKLTIFGIPHAWILMFLFFFGTIFYLTHALYMKNTFNLTLSSLIWIICAAILSYLVNLCVLRSIAEAPNPGYTTAIVGCSSLVVVLGACLFFGASLSAGKVFGIVLCLLGVFMLSL